MNRPLKTPTLRLEGFVGEDITNAGARAFCEANPGRPLAVEINSPGGVATEGVAIYNTLKAHAAPVTVHVNGVAASAASLIAMAGDTIVMLAGSLMMIHDPSGVTIGPAKTHRQSADVLDKIAEQVAAIYAERSGQTPDAVAALMAAETWFTGAEAVDNGFADFTAADASAPAFMCNYRTIFNHAPAALRQLAPIQEPVMTTALPNPSVKTPPPVAVREAHKTIMATCRAAKLSIEDAETIIEQSGLDPAKAKTLVIDLLATRNTDPDAPQINAGPDADRPQLSALSKTIGDAIYARMSGKPATGDARNWAGASILDMGAALLEARGVRILSRNKDSLARQITMVGGMHTTSDFVQITGSAGHRVLMEAYAAAETPLKLLARSRNANDFRTLATLRLGEMPQLLEVPEGGEIKHGSRAESTESFRLRTFARIFSLSRQAIINDDLQAFADMSAAWGRAAAETEATELVTLLLANSGNGPTMEDTKALYHADHGNKAASGTAITIAALSAGRAAMRDTKGLDGKTPISATPKYLVVGSAKETEAEQVLATLAAATAADTNPFSGRLTLLVEPRLPGNAWRLFADQAQLPVIDIAYLNGEAGPQVETREGWETLGAEYRAVLDFGCGVSGWRGTYLNTGA